MAKRVTNSVKKVHQARREIQYIEEHILLPTNERVTEK
jgi:hypothetical protein